jgi:predicted alpha/beta hydrolase family esterase
MRNNKTKNCIVTPGFPASVEISSNPKTRTYDKHWIPMFNKKLTAAGIPSETAVLPEAWYPDYDKLKAAFEKHDITESTILVGHSGGNAFLVRWLGETKTKVAKLILVAPWKIAEPGDELRERLYNYPIDESIKSRVGEIIMFTADNEQSEGIDSLKIYHDAIGGKVIKLKDHGHYILNHMETEEFPELLEAALA